MAATFLLFDFGTNEDSVQKARHHLEAWKQAFRLGNKMLFKLERQSSAPSSTSEESSSRDSKGKHDGKKREHAPNEDVSARVRLLIRLDFSAHEKHLFQTWLARIPREEPFKTVDSVTVDRNAPSYEQISELFDSLN